MKEALKTCLFFWRKALFDDKKRNEEWRHRPETLEVFLILTFIVTFVINQRSIYQKVSSLLSYLYSSAELE